MKRVKTVTAAILLLFAAVTAAVQTVRIFRPVKENILPGGKYLVCFHAQVRCPSCRTMERLGGKVLLPGSSQNPFWQEWSVFCLSWRKPPVLPL